MNDIAVLHGDCLVCAARGDTKTAEEEIVLMLAMMFAGMDFLAVFRGLCFAHRREVEAIGDSMDAGDGDTEAS